MGMFDFLLGSQDVTASAGVWPWLTGFGRNPYMTFNRPTRQTYQGAIPYNPNAFPSGPYMSPRSMGTQSQMPFTPGANWQQNTAVPEMGQTVPGRTLTSQRVSVGSDITPFQAFWRSLTPEQRNVYDPDQMGQMNMTAEQQRLYGDLQSRQAPQQPQGMFPRINPIMLALMSRGR